MINYTTAQTIEELQQILSLQKENLPTTISKTELQKEGFVTVNHDLDLLQEMNTPFPHIIAKDKEKVIGYTLVMLKKMQDKVPVLQSMFEKINTLGYDGVSLEQTEYFVMGQVCIKKGYRGQGIFKGLYETLKKEMAKKFKYVITEIASRNRRSIRAHQKVGFKNLHTFQSKEGEEWVIVLWDWKNESQLL